LQEKEIFTDSIQRARKYKTAKVAKIAENRLFPGNDMLTTIRVKRGNWSCSVDVSRPQFSISVLHEDTE
jgi:hypothetical protein